MCENLARQQQQQQLWGILENLCVILYIFVYFIYGFWFASLALRVQHFLANTATSISQISQPILATLSY